MSVRDYLGDKRKKKRFVAIMSRKKAILQVELNTQEEWESFMAEDGLKGTTVHVEAYQVYAPHKLSFYVFLYIRGYPR